MVSTSQDKFFTTDQVQVFLQVITGERRRCQPMSRLFDINGSSSRTGGGGGSRRFDNFDALVEFSILQDDKKVSIHLDVG